MVRVAFALSAVALIAACDNTTPAGGQGYFDPPAAAPLPDPTQTISRLPSTDVTQPGTQGAPLVTETIQPTDPETAALTADVTELLGQDGAAAVPLDGDIGIDPNDTSINLAEQTQEEQKRQRAIAAAQRQAAQEQLVVIEPEPVPQVDPNANAVAFARNTTHPVGTKRYNRPAFRSRAQAASNCRKIGNDDDAQRQFLANGGPNTDRFNLDPDGDGFACKFDPEPYRKLKF